MTHIIFVAADPTSAYDSYRDYVRCSWRLDAEDHGLVYGGRGSRLGFYHQRYD